MEQKIIQITSGKGPPECERVVALLLAKILQQARKEKLLVEVLETVKGEFNGTLLSALVLIKDKKAWRFCTEWEGTIQWVAQSPYRKFHKRRNWFVGVNVYDITRMVQWNERDIRFQTMRSSGPGGQHVNKTESAVRATHYPSGISVTASSERSQLMNKKEAIARLKQKLMSWYAEEAGDAVQEQWLSHQAVERGDAVKVFKESLE
jgi:peptide chain release factor